MTVLVNNSEHRRYLKNPCPKNSKTLFSTYGQIFFSEHVKFLEVYFYPGITSTENVIQLPSKFSQSDISSNVWPIMWPENNNFIWLWLLIFTYDCWSGGCDSFKHIQAIGTFITTALWKDSTTCNRPKY